METDSNKKSVTIEDVAVCANSMITNGVQPTVKGVMSLIGGRTDNVAKYLKQFWADFNKETESIIGDLGSSEIGKLLAVEVNNIVIRRTENQKKKISSLELQLEEWQGLLEEQEISCQRKIEEAQALAAKQIEAAEKALAKANEKAEQAIVERDEAKAQAVGAKNNAEAEVKEIRMEANNTVKAEQQKAVTLVESAKTESASLVAAAEKRVNETENEVRQLREQNRALTVDEAKRQIEKQQFEDAQVKLASLQQQLADERTASVKLSTENNGAAKEITRLSSELAGTKDELKKVGNAQVMLIEAQKQITQLQHDLSQSEREKQSLSQALAVSSSKEKK